MVGKTVEPKYKVDISKLVTDGIFYNNVGKQLLEIKNKRDRRPVAKGSFGYRRDWYDIMVSEGTFSTRSFVDEFALILQKKSTLSAEIRSVINTIGQKAMQETLLHYHPKP